MSSFIRAILAVIAISLVVITLALILSENLACQGIVR